MSDFDLVTSPLSIGKIVLKNRLVFPPIVTNLANKDGTVSDELLEFVTARARGGVGLVITENTAVNQAGRLFANTHIDGDEFIPGLRRLFDSVHEQGSKVLIQLDHEGRETTAEATSGAGPVAPSAVPSPTFKNNPREMTLKEIELTIQDFVAAALRAKEAGADGVELQGAHGFLIHQFMSPLTNKRTDEYGGDLENRTRFVTRIIEKIKEAAGKDFIVCCRISADDFLENGLNLTETVSMACLIEQAGADVIHVAAGVLETADHVTPTEEYPDVPHAQLAKAIREAVNIPVIAVGKVCSLEEAEALIADGAADLVAMGRELIADPELPKKELSGRFSEVIRCIHCNSCFQKILSQSPAIACKLHSDN